MNTLAQYMAKFFLEVAEKENISFHFGKILRVYDGKIGSNVSVTLETFILGKFVKYINNDGSQCVFLLGNECHDQTHGFAHYIYEKLQRILVGLRGSITVSVIQRLRQTRIKLTLRNGTSILVIFGKEQF